MSLPEDGEERVDGQNDANDDESIVLLLVEGDAVQRRLPIFAVVQLGNRAVVVE